MLIRLFTLYLLVFAGTTAVSGQAPVANFTGSPLSGCSPVIVNFQDQSTGNPFSWNWDFGNGNTSTLQNPTATYFTPGTYSVSLTVTNASGANTITRQQLVTVHEPPVVNFTADRTSGCFPLQVQFTDLSTAGNGNTNTAWQWDFGNGIISTVQNPLATYTTAGTFTVTLRVTNDKGCTRTISRPNYITVTSGVTSSFTNTPAAVCTPPVTISFTSTSTGPPTLSYAWNFGDGGTSTLPNPTHTYTAGGTFIATLVTSSTAGCQDTARRTFIIGGYSTSFNAVNSTCVNQPVIFTNTSVPAPNASFWVFGDGSTANTTNATHTYAAPGTYIVRLYNTYATCSDSAIQSITINDAPVADFSAPVTARCGPPLTVNFQDLSSGGATNWQWDFGNGGVSNLQNPSHTYTGYGIFDVALIATNAAGCSDTLVRPGYVRVQRPVINIASFPQRGCIPYTITPIATITTPDIVTSYLWDFGDGLTSTLSNPVHTYTLQGTYTIKLIITTSGGCTDSLVIPAAVQVGTKPVANFSATPLNVCARREVYFTDLSAPADEWYWDFGDGGTSNLQNPVHVFNDTGYFDIRLIAFNNGCPDTLIIPNYIYVRPPIAAFTPTPDCSNRLRFSFTDNSIGPLTWEWNFGDGSPLVTSQNPVHTFPALGVYTVQLIVTNNGCADTSIQTINAVDESPDFVADNTAACKIGYINFNAVLQNYNNVTNYAWDFGDGGTVSGSGLAGVSHAYLNAGTYTVTLTITDINGCVETVTKTNYIRINGPVAGFTPVNTSGCAGLITTFNDLSTGDGINSLTSWHWNFGDGTTQTFTAPPFQHTYAAAGIFSVQLIVTDALGCKDSITQNNIIVTTDPLPDFVSADTLTCPGAIVTFTNSSLPANMIWLWSFGDGGSSTLAAPVHSYTNPGDYTVTLQVTDSIGCVDSLVRTAYIHVENPVADFTVSDSISSCLPFEVQFTNTSPYFTSLLWDFGPGEGVSTLANPVHYYSVGGTYPVKLTVTSPGGCVDSVTKNIYVYDTTGSTLRYLPLGGCKPLNVTLNSFTQGPMASYLWDFGDGNIQTTNSPNANHTYTSWGNFLPRLIMQDPAGCIIPLPGPDTIFVTGANAKFGYSDSVFCDFGTVNFSDSTTFNDPVTSYQWSFGDGATSNQQNPSHTYTTPGLYTVQLALQTQLGCRDTATKPLVIKVVQRPLIDIAGDSVVCVGKSLLHSGIFIQPDTSIVSWQWNFPNGVSSILQNPPQQTYNTVGNFVITTIATNSTGCKDTTRQNIYVNPLPTVTLPAQITVQAGFPITIPATYSPNTISWQWSPSAGLSCTTCPAPDAGPKFDTRYLVYFTDINGCVNTGAVLLTVICKNSNLFIPNTFSPNGDGSNDIFYPRGKGLERVKTLRIFNRWGEVVFERYNFPVNDPLSGWDGKYKGKEPKADVYVWQAEVYCDNGDIIKLNGNVSLIF
jgi:gliding motility-associated-like protein